MMSIMKKINKFYKKNEEIVNYLIIGGLTTIINIITKYVLLFIFFDAKNSTELQVSVVISWIISILFAYVANRRMVFKSKNESIIYEFIKFIESRVLTLIIEMVFMYIFVSLLKLDTDLLVVILSVISQIIVIILNYVFSKIFVFKTKSS